MSPATGPSRRAAGLLHYPRALRLFLTDERNVNPELLSCPKKRTPFAELLCSHLPVDIEFVESLREVSFAAVSDGDDNDGLFG
ncbi:hypothetical protein SNK03_010527 [Fusarium graminearum]|nr:unnamed protein product [Fusarium graminearum]CAG1997962.1 unnamed protein product [Fusarium graminearum]CAG2007449.1 unnamed protein product [Fusarium graminearum]